jgi:hypothetical protein
VVGLAAVAGFGGAGALEVEAGVVGVGHADAAVHLHHLVGDQVQGVAHLRLGQRDQLGGVRRAVVDGGQGRLDAGAGQLQIGEHLGRAVLQGLERADDLAELHARLEVVEGGLEGLDRRAEHLGREAGAGAVEHLFKKVPALVGFAEHGVGADLDIVE